MKTAYTPDNTRSSIAILLVIAAVIIAVAVLVGLSDKPEVSTIVISAAGEPTFAAGASTASTFGFDVDDSTSAETGVLLDEFGEPFGDAASDSAADGSSDDPAATTRTAPEGQIIVVPTSEPTPTPAVAAAVEPTLVPAQSDDSAQATTTLRSSPSLPSSSGSVQGSFFTKGDENDGAVVAQNLIDLSFAQDGSGAFQGVLDITYADGTHILLNMSGPLTWAPTNPQVEATLSGAFTLDAPIDADDVTADDAELSISSLEAGSGSLCTTKCFGFTFPPQ